MRLFFLKHTRRSSIHQFIKKSLLLCWPVLVCSVGLAQTPEEDVFASAVRPTDALTPNQQLEAMHVPEGFKLSLFASEPDIHKPINMAFDEKGRLWVSSTVDYPFADLDKPGDSIQVLEDTDGDGKADRFTTFVDGITHPMGLIPYKDGVIAFCIPNIYFFRDTDGDGVCDKRELMFGPFDYSRDTHGLNNGFRRGFDGWIYACHGFNNHSKVTGPDGNVLDVSSGSTYRFRDDGSRIERFTFGQINPFGMTFDQRGDLFDSDCHTKPLALMIRDGQYEGFGRQHDGLGFAPDVIEHLHGSTAIAGLSQMVNSRLPKEFQNNYIIGNVMTSRVNRDSLSLTGSTMKAVEEPDFVISDDPWFRPVDIQLGPDGAMYIADFYNKIIGHYEVDLKHPGRDRTSGRIWKVEYVGTADAPLAKTSLTELKDLKKANVQELIAELANENLPRRMLAMNQFSDRIHDSAIPELKQALQNPKNDDQHIALLWSLHRLKGLTSEQLMAAGQSDRELVRIHAQRILGETPNWNDQLKQLAMSGLKDENAFVQRAAADTMARNPSKAHIQPLLDLLQTASASDTMLVYQLKVALRNQLRIDGSLPELLKSEITPTERDILAQIALGLNHRDAATYLLDSFTSPDNRQTPSLEIINRIALFANASDTQRLVDLIRQRWQGDVWTQHLLMHSVREGLSKQGAGLPDSVRAWGHDLVQEIFQLSNEGISWTEIPESSTSTMTWDYQARPFTDGAETPRVLSSLIGGESMVSTMRSPDFKLPEQFTFWMCGQDGFPGEELQHKNFCRLVLASTGEELAREYVPRNDTAHPYTFTLPDHVGQDVFFEIVDGSSAPSWAWIAAGRTDPNVIKMPTIGIGSEIQITVAAIDHIRDMRLDEFLPQLQTLAQTRSHDKEIANAIAKYLIASKPRATGSGLIAALEQGDLNDLQRHEILNAILHPDQEREEAVLANCLKTQSASKQEIICQSLLQNGGGALLLHYAQEGILGGRVLNSARVRPQIDLIGNTDIRGELISIADKSPKNSAEVEAKIQTAIQRISPSPANPKTGRELFVKHCSACHQIQGVGKVIGPQLDGIGNRGIARLVEDVLTPNQNVDAAFRNRTYILEDGRVLNGVFRRNEGVLTILANNAGDEISFPTADIEEEVESTVSIMPENFVETLSDQDITDLMAYLLDQR